MNIAIVGTGYVGLVSGTCFAEMGAHVTCVDVDAQKIEKLKNGIMPIYEPGLEELVKRNVEYGRLKFTTDLTEVLDEVEVVFSAVGTPPDEDGSADLKYVLAVARQFGQNINKYTILVTKSTVPVGTAQKVKAAIQDELAELQAFMQDYAANAQWSASEASIALYRSLEPLMRPALPAFWSADAEDVAVLQYLDGLISAETFVSELKDALNMAALEGQ